MSASTESVTPRSEVTRAVDSHSLGILRVCTPNGKRQPDRNESASYPALLLRIDSVARPPAEDSCTSRFKRTTCSNLRPV